MNDFIYEGEFANDMPHGFGKYYYKEFIVKGIWRNGKYVEIINFERGDSNNFNNSNLNFEIQPFTLLPHMLPNLTRIESKVHKIVVGTTPRYLNTLN